MNNVLKFAVFGAISMALVSCGGSDGETAMPDASPITERFSTKVSVIRNDDGIKTAERGKTEDVEAVFVWKEGSDDFTATLTAFRRKTTFTQDDLDDDGDLLLQEAINGEGGLIILALVDDAFRGFLGGTRKFRYFSRFGTTDYNPKTGVKHTALGVFGVDTEPDKRPSTQESYKGSVPGFSILKIDKDAKLPVFIGTLTVDVDFESGEVTNGVIDNVKINEEDVDDEYLLRDTKLTDTGFTTSLIYNPDICTTNCPSVTTSEVEGRFFGPAAEELGGRLSIEGVNADGDDYVAAGAFGGEKAD